MIWKLRLESTSALHNWRHWRLSHGKLSRYIQQKVQISYPYPEVQNLKRQSWWASWVSISHEIAFFVFFSTHKDCKSLALVKEMGLGNHWLKKNSISHSLQYSQKLYRKTQKIKDAYIRLNHVWNKHNDHKHCRIKIKLQQFGEI